MWAKRRASGILLTRNFDLVVVMPSIAMFMLKTWRSVAIESG